jgi:predicted ATPase/class 3 adenylate cyclase
MHTAPPTARRERCASLARRALIVVQAAQTVRRLPTGIVTFVMTDIEGSTRLFRERGDEYVALLETHHDLLTQAFESYRGVEVATEGDGLVVVFDDAANAVQACLAGQLALRSHPWPSGADIRVRMGLHNAEATPTGNNYVSLGLHQAARICAGAHGGQIVLSEATASDVRARLPSDVTLSLLGSFQLRGFSAPARLFQVHHPQLPADFPPLRAQGVVHHNMPFHRAGFVGRTEERAALASLIRRTGLVTVVGVGGVGKTRLAVQVAFDVMDDFADGAWLVELASARDRQGIASAVAAVLHLAELRGGSLEQVVLDHLSDKAALIVLDNCEQVLEAAADFTEQLTRRSPNVIVIATSREPLAIDGEVIWRLEPLPVIEPGTVSGPRDVFGIAALTLFEQRAAMVRPGFRISNDNANDVARILQQLEGIPLAIELAAAALADRSVTGVLEGLSDRFSLLTYGRRTAPARHQTLRAALEWSLDLLGPDERLLFGRLAIFARTGSIDAAQKICGAAPLSESSVPQLVRRLLRASLLSARENLEHWTMLDSVQELARLELARSGEADVLAQRHRDWFTHRAESLGPDVGLRGRNEAGSGLLADLDNIRLALATGLAAGDGDGVMRTATAMAQFWISHGDWSAGIGHLQDALALSNGSGLVRGRALAALGNLLLLRGETADAEARFHEANKIAAMDRDEITLARSQSGLGYVAFRGSDLEQAEARWKDALEHAKRTGDERLAAGILRSLAIAAGSRGDQPAAGRMLDRAIRSAEEAADDQLLRLLLGSRAEIDLWLGRYEEAENLYGQALRLASTIGDLSARPLLLSELGWVALLIGDVVTSHRLASEAADLAEELGNRRTLASSLRLRAEGLVRQCRFPEAAADLDRALTVARGLAAPAEIAGVLCTQAYAAVEQLHLTDATRLAESALATMSLGHSMRSTFPAWILGVVALARRDLDTATDQFRARVEGDAAEAAPRHQANNCWGLACVSNTAGRIPKAARLHREALALRHSIGDRLGVAESLIGTAAVVASADRVVAGALIGAAQRLRTELGAVVTPRQADDLAAARAMLGEHETSPADSRPYDEAAAVARAVGALEEIESLGGRSPAKEKG